jgi:uncharacterized membrane protein
MEGSAFMLSLLAFVIETGLFVVTVLEMLLPKSAAEGRGAKMLVYIALVFVCGMAALASPLVYLARIPAASQGIHPVVVAILICAALMPLFLLVANGWLTSRPTRHSRGDAPTSGAPLN